MDSFHVHLDLFDRVTKSQASFDFICTFMFVNSLVLCLCRVLFAITSKKG